LLAYPAKTQVKPSAFGGFETASPVDIVYRSAYHQRGDSGSWTDCRERHGQIPNQLNNRNGNASYERSMEDGYWQLVARR
jgi:hypothetical protein